MDAIVITFIPQRIFKRLDVKPVPWKEEARSVNLHEKSVTQDTEKAVWIHLHIQVHVGVHEIYSTWISNTNDLRGKQPTVKVRAVRGHRRNQRKRGVDGGGNIRVVRLGGETLEISKAGQVGSTTRMQTAMMTLIALIQAVRSAELMLLHSLRTLGDLHPCALTEVSKREETSKTRRKPRKAMGEWDTEWRKHRCWGTTLAFEREVL